MRTSVNRVPLYKFITLTGVVRIFTGLTSGFGCPSLQGGFLQSASV